MANYTEQSFIHLIDHAIIEKYRLGEWIPEPSTGQIFSRKTMRALKPALENSGYLTISTQYRHLRLKAGVGRAIWVMVNGAPLDASLEVDHINRIKTDNRLENLRLVTIAENRQNRASAKIDMPKAEKIRKEFAAGATITELAAAYACSRSTIARVVRYQTWIPQSAGGESDAVC